jgi:hypothetical protein
MTIPESQLDTWSHQGSVTQSASTYGTIKLALESATAGYAHKSYSIFLQGSYGNDTNIYAESDVDVVMKLMSLYYYDISALTAEEQRRFHSSTGGPETYDYFTFKNHVIEVLEKRFGSTNVKPGNKAIKIVGSGNRRDADVLACTNFRKYRSFTGASSDYEEGICFWSSSGQIANYPRHHSQNCTTKHQGTASWFKPMVRILKNMRSRLVADGTIDKGTAPSYYIEGLMYNIPASKFGSSYGDTFAAAMNWLNETDRAQLVCANEQYYLLRDYAETCWPIANGNAFINAVIKLWNDW